ncbi:MAG: hypothetical protein WDN29_13545 [Methylovirgula sp.]
MTTILPVLGGHPSASRPPIILDTQASMQLGYMPVGGYAKTVHEHRRCG